MSGNLASGNGDNYFTGHSQKDHTFGDGHGYITSAAGTGTGMSCGYGKRWNNGYSYQNSLEDGGNISGTANGYGYASCSG